MSTLPAWIWLTNNGAEGLPSTMGTVVPGGGTVALGSTRSTASARRSGEALWIRDLGRAPGKRPSLRAPPPGGGAGGGLGPFQAPLLSRIEMVLSRKLAV